MKLYYAPQTRASRVRWTLEELRVPYELITFDMAAGEHRSPEYTKIHPLNQVPALVDGSMTVLESTAICLYLADRFPEGALAPPPEQRAHYYQWCCYAGGSLEGPLLDIFLNTIRLPEDQRNPGKVAEARQTWLKVASVVEDALQTGPFMLGEQFTVADVMIGGTLNWAAAMGLLENFPRCQEYLGRLRTREAYQRAQAA